MRLVTRKVATLQEIETHYDIVDVYDVNEALDLADEAERLQAKEQEKAMKRGR